MSQIKTDSVKNKLIVMSLKVTALALFLSMAMLLTYDIVKYYLSSIDNLNVQAEMCESNVTSAKIFNNKAAADQE